MVWCNNVVLVYIFGVIVIVIVIGHNVDGNCNWCFCNQSPITRWTANVVSYKYLATTALVKEAYKNGGSTGPGTPPPPQYVSPIRQLHVGMGDVSPVRQLHVGMGDVFLIPLGISDVTWAFIFRLNLCFLYKHFRYNVYANNQPLNQQAKEQKVKFKTKVNVRGEIMHA